MKDIFKTGIYVAAFALAGVFFQISCSNADDEAPVTFAAAGEKFVFVKKDFQTTSEQSIWIANLDGSEQTEIPITLPVNRTFYSIYSSGEHSTVKLSGDGNSILFTVQDNASKTYIYSCNIDGTNLQEVANFDENQGIFL